MLVNLQAVDYQKNADRTNGEDKEHPLFYALIRDARRFISSYRSIIEMAPLQTYASALVFSPQDSPIRKSHAVQLPRWILRYPPVETDWSPVLQVLEGHSRSVSVLAFSPDGKLLASGAGDNTVRLWEASTGKLRNTFQSPHALALTFSPDGQRVALASYRRGGKGVQPDDVQLYDTTTGSLIQLLEGLSARVLALAFTPDGTRIVLVSRDGKVRLWNLVNATLEEIREVQGPIQAATLSTSGESLAIGYHETGEVELCHFRTEETTTLLEDRDLSFRTLAFSSDGSQLACGGRDVNIWETTTGEVRISLSQPTSSHRIQALAFSSDAAWLVGGTTDQLILFWEVQTGALGRTLRNGTER